MQRIIQVNAMLLVLPFALVGCKRSDEAVFLQYYHLAVREIDREIEMLKKSEKSELKYTVKERVIQRLEGDMWHLESKMARFHNKPQLRKELYAKRDQLSKIRVAIIDKDIDREIEKLKGREPGLEEAVIKKLRAEIRLMYMNTIFSNKPDLQTELDAKRDQIIETRIASLKNKDNELPR